MTSLQFPPNVFFSFFCNIPYRLSLPLVFKTIVTASHHSRIPSFFNNAFTVNARHNGIAQDSKSLFCVIGDAILSYNIDLNLTWIVESVFDALCNVACKEYHLVI